MTRRQRAKEATKRWEEASHFLSRVADIDSSTLPGELDQLISELNQTFLEMNLSRDMEAELIYRKVWAEFVTTRDEMDRRIGDVREDERQDRIWSKFPVRTVPTGRNGGARETVAPYLCGEY